ncbi:MAG: ATP-dependent RecD-like DNA helicase [Eubacterium sp.]|nr:ATP-dependent RecD-like DNA helicase [Eubacterium sp.]
MVCEGYIEKIIYRSEETGYTVFSVETTEGEEIFVGTLPGIYEGMYIQAEGEYVHHPQYDIQFSVRTCELSMPSDVLGIERYLGSGLVKGIGQVLAKRIVRAFKEDTLRIMAEEPERLAEVKGISLRKARELGETYQSNHDFQEIVIFLTQYGIHASLAMKIYKIYGKDVYSILRENPYRLVEDVPGVGFRRADEIAAAVGVSADSEYRLQSALFYVLSQAMNEGHVYLPEEQLLAETFRVMNLEGDWETFEERAHDQLIDLGMQKKLVCKLIHPDGDPEGPTMSAIYTWWNYQYEKDSARRLVELCIRHETPAEELDAAIDEVEKELGIELDPIQRTAVETAICSGVAVITGGPGTGKTTIINAVIRYFEMHGLAVELAAPTGRAAKRITESTGVKARTIHRLLEFTGEPGQDNSRRVYFARNEENPLECDAVIIDEASMLDSQLFHALLLALTYGTRLILVGDTDQLPSVGAGNVLHDVIASDCFPVTTLSTIFRQAEESRIITNAHKVRNGEHLTIDNKNKDFFFIPRQGPEATGRELETLIRKDLPKYLGITEDDIQVLTPMRKYELGVEALNRRLQNTLNPSTAMKREKQIGDLTFREGDKVMQIRNNYKMEWRTPPSDENSYIEEEGVGVFNGDMGKILRVNDFDEELEVRFDDGRIARYPFSMADELEHAFAITIHKSQGSEYPAVIIPLYRGPEKLLTRNLLYTAITRAKTMVVLVGDLSMVNRMIDNESEQLRFTSLDTRIREVYGA